MNEEELINSFKLYLDELKNLCKRLHINNGEDDADVIMLEKVLNLIEKQQKEIENSISKDKINNKLKELSKKLVEPNNDRWEKDDDVYYGKIKAQIQVLKEILGE